MTCCNAGCAREATVGVLIQYSWGRVPPVPMCAACSQHMPSHYLIVPLPTPEELAAPTIQYDQATAAREQERLMPHFAAQAGVSMAALRPAWHLAGLVTIVIGLMMGIFVFAWIVASR